MPRKRKEPKIVSEFRKRFPGHIYLECWDKGFKDGSKPSKETINRWMGDYMRRRVPKKKGIMEWV